MKKNSLIALFIALTLLFTACSLNTNSPEGTGNPSVNNSSNSNNSNNSSDSNTSATSAPTPTVSVTDAASLEKDITSDFTISGGEFTYDSGCYTITAEGEYTLTGSLNGNIIVDAGDAAKVTLLLNNVKITSTDTSAIYVKSADKVTIKALEGSYNEINDNRALATESDANAEDSPANAAGAISAKTDLTISGKGALVVKGSYKNGIHTSKDLTIKNLTLKVSAENNAIKGKDSITIEDAEIIAVSYSGDGVKTENSDLSSKNNQRGTITIKNSNLEIYAACDGISAAYDFLASDSCNISIKTSDYSEYSKPVSSTNSSTSSGNNGGWGWGGGFGGFGGFGGGFGGMNGGGNSNKTSYSSKGIKAGNSIEISDATITIESKDDGLHAKSDTLENGVKGAGTVNINSGNIVITCADDGIHADSTLNISGGYVNIITSYEGLEGNIINISGGQIFVYATDDGVNASSGSASGTPSINISGGYLDVTTPSGDTDAIDSNGTYIQTGGFVLVKGGNSQGSMAGSVDTDRGVTVTGGTIIAFGGICETPENSQNGYTARGTSFAAGDYTLKDSDGNTILSVSLPSNYSSMWVSSDLIKTGSSYTFYKGTTSVLNWTQTAGHMGATGSQGGFGPGGSQGGGRPGRR